MSHQKPHDNHASAKVVGQLLWLSDILRTIFNMKVWASVRISSLCSRARGDQADCIGRASAVMVLDLLVANIYLLIFLDLPFSVRTHDCGSLCFTLMH